MNGQTDRQARDGEELQLFPGRIAAMSSGILGRVKHETWLQTELGSQVLFLKATIYPPTVQTLLDPGRWDGAGENPICLLFFPS